MAFYPFFYHIVHNDKPSHLRHLFPIKSWEDFKHDIDYLKKNMTSLDLSELHQWPALPSNHFLITFDDGVSELYEVAVYLAKENIQALFFVNPDFIEQRCLFTKHLASYLCSELRDKGVLTENAKSELLHHSVTLEFLHQEAKKNHVQLPGPNDVNWYLTIEQLHKMAAMGHVIGAHSMNHPHYQLISAQERLSQTTQSCAWIKEHFPHQAVYFAFPYEDYFLPKSFFNELKSDAHHPAITFGTSAGKLDSIPTNIQRIDGEQSGWSIKKIIKRHKQRSMLRTIIGRNKLNRK